MKKMHIDKKTIFFSDEITWFRNKKSFFFSTANTYDSEDELICGS